MISHYHPDTSVVDSSLRLENLSECSGEIQVPGQNVSKAFRIWQSFEVEVHLIDSTYDIYIPKGMEHLSFDSSVELLDSWDCGLTRKNAADPSPAPAFTRFDLVDNASSPSLLDRQPPPLHNLMFTTRPVLRLRLRLLRL